jgi:hypothetical protein
MNQAKGFRFPIGLLAAALISLPALAADQSAWPTESSANRLCIDDSQADNQGCACTSPGGDCNVSCAFDRSAICRKYYSSGWYCSCTCE